MNFAIALGTFAFAKQVAIPTSFSLIEVLVGLCPNAVQPPRGGQVSADGIEASRASNGFEASSGCFVLFGARRSVAGAR
jgi:hypothetical protein